MTKGKSPKSDPGQPNLGQMLQSLTEAINNKNNVLGSSWTSTAKAASPIVNFTNFHPEEILDFTRAALFVRCLNGGSSVEENQFTILRQDNFELEDDLGTKLTLMYTLRKESGNINFYCFNDGAVKVDRSNNKITVVSSNKAMTDSINKIIDYHNKF